MRLNHRQRDAIAADTRAMAHTVADLATKYGVSPYTIARHALLLAVPLHRGAVMSRAIVAYFASLLRRRQARRRLQRIVEANATSIATTEYRIRRVAAKAGWARRRAGA